MALNPFQPFSCLYSPELMREYHVALCPQVTLVFDITVLLQSPGVKLLQIYLSKTVLQDKPLLSVAVELCGYCALKYEYSLSLPGFKTSHLCSG